MMKRPPHSPESAAALRRFFGWLESNYGGLIFDDPPHVITSQRKLRSEDLQQLTKHEATVLHVKEFFPKQAALQLGQELAQEGEPINWKVSTSRGLESSDVSTLGQHPPYNIASALGKEDAYFEGVLREFEARRFDMNRESNVTSTTLRQLWPLDLLRLNLDEAWPAGAGLARSRETLQPFSGGLPRIMKGPSRWKHGFIHCDEMGPLDPNQGLFSANIYLQLPEPNQEVSDKNNKNNADKGPMELLHIWPLGIRSRWDWYRNAISLSGLSSQDAEDQIRLRHVLGDPVAVSCEPGDLVLLCVQRPHAAVGFSRGTRVSLQCFIQHKGIEERLMIDN